VQAFSVLETGCYVPIVGVPRGTSYSDIVLKPLRCIGGMSLGLYCARSAHLGFPLSEKKSVLNVLLAMCNMCSCSGVNNSGTYMWVDWCLLPVVVGVCKLVSWCV
jgi:hypothetical protein